MNIPGFSAETSLYRTSGHYRMIGKFGQVGATIHPTLSINDFVKSSLTLTDLVDKYSLGVIYLDRPSPFLRCGALGKACCHAPTASQNVPAFGPLVSCQQGLGCDITIGKCVSSCGGTGQVCCDGPETRALKWTADGKVYSPNFWNMREMCEAGVCDKQTHRCITCGTHDGGPCCSSDAAQATARCFRDAKTGNRLVCIDRWAGDTGGICVECGKSGQPKCLTAGEAPCDDGLVERDGICVLCGWAGLPTCDRGEPCRDGRSVPNRSFSECLPAGGPNQPCRPDGGCDYQGLFCNSGRICQPCGHPGQICCPPGRLPGNAACQQPGECRDNRCFACGYDNMPVCTIGDPCKCLCKPVDGWCRPCGHDGQTCCSHPWWACYDGAHCDDGVCRRPSGGGGGGNEWKTCSGQPYTYSTKQWPVTIEDDNGCVGYDSFAANSPDEALGCARTKHGAAAVIDAPLQSHTFAVTCSYTGCNQRTYNARNHAQAKSCAEHQAGDCSVEDGPC